MSLASIARSIANRVLPARISVTSDSLADAIRRKAGKSELSASSVSKMTTISNEGSLLFLHQSELEMVADGTLDPDHCIASIRPLRAAEVMLQDSYSALKETTMGKVAAATVKDHLVFCSSELETARKGWTQLYWQNFDTCRAAYEQTGRSGLARNCLGYAPDPATMTSAVRNISLMQAFALMGGSQQEQLPDAALRTLDSLFNRIYRIPYADGSVSFANVDFPDPAQIRDFKCLPMANQDIIQILTWVKTLPAGPIQTALTAKISDYSARIAMASSYWLSEAGAALSDRARSAEGHDMLRYANAWLGRQVESETPSPMPSPVADRRTPSTIPSSSVDEMETDFDPGDFGYRSGRANLQAVLPYAVHPELTGHKGPFHGGLQHVDHPEHLPMPAPMARQVALLNRMR